MYRLRDQTATKFAMRDRIPCVKVVHNLVYAGCDDGGLYTYDLKASEWKPVMMIDDDQAIKCIAIQPKANNDVVVTGISNMIQAHDARSGKATWKLKGHTQAVTSLSFNEEVYEMFPEDDSSTNCYLASGSNDKTVKIWDLRKEACVSTLRKHTKAVTAVQMRGARILTGGSFGDSGLVNIWNRGSGEVVRSLETGEDKVSCIRFDGFHMAIGAGKKLSLYSAVDSEPFWEVEGETEVRDVAFSEKYMVVARADWDMILYDFSR